MNAPTKNNADILADQQEFMAAYDRAREAFGGIEGVAGVGFGQKQRGGQFTDDVGIVVFVEEKKPLAELAPDQRIPPAFEGYLTDVRVVLQRVPGGCDNDTQYDVIRGGIKIVAKTTGLSGTLGCIVRKRGDTGRENVYILSNKHVLYANGATAGDYIYHPYAPSSDQSRPSTTLGPVQALAFYNNETATVPVPGGSPVSDSFFVDAAIARLDIDSKCCGSTCTKDVLKYEPKVVDLQIGGQDTFTDARSVARDPSIVVPTGGGGPFVFKVGRITGKTRGVVRSISAVVNLAAIPGFPAVRGVNVIEIDLDSGTNCHNNPYFAEQGDSGSIVVDENRRVIGLIHGVPGPGVAGNTATACHILPVLDKLGVCIPTAGGTSHGSCGATDGSGTGSATTAAGTASADEPATAPAGTATAPAGAAPLEAAGPVAVSESERVHMMALRDEFRATPQGRALHEVFAQVRREIGYLVRNNRRVKIAWYRGHGPAYLTHTINHLRGRTGSVPLDVDGVSRAELLDAMAQVLAVHGSNPLRAAIERYRDRLMPILSGARTVEDAMAQFAAVVDLPRMDVVADVA